MSLVFMSGWETQKNMDTWLWTMSSYSGATGFTSSVRRGPSYAFYFANANEWIRRVLPTSNNEVYMQVCFYWTSSPNAGTILRFGKNVNIYFTLAINSSTKLDLYTGDSSTLVASGSTILQTKRWYVLEVYFKRNASGTIAVRLNGLSECSWSGDTTLSASTISAVAQMRFESGALGVDSTSTLPDWSVNGSPTASSIHMMEGAYSMLSPGTGSDYISIADASLPDGYLLKNGDTTQQGTIMYWYKATTVAPSGQYWRSIGKYDYAGNNICFNHEVTNARMRVNWGYGTSGHTVEAIDTNTIIAGVWNHYSWSFNGPGKRWDMRIFDLHNSSLGTFSRNCTNVLRTNCSAPYDIGVAALGFYDDLLIFNYILPDWSQDCIRSLYYDPLFRGQDPHTLFQSNWILELSSTIAGTYLDDVVVNDASGSVNTSWVDRAHVILLKTKRIGTSDDFTLSETSPIVGTDLVKRVPASTLDFIYSSTAGACHSFIMYGAPLKTENVLAVMETACLWQTPTAGLTCQLTMRAGNTIFLSPGFIAPRSPMQECYVNYAYTNPYPNLTYYIFESDTSEPFTDDDVVDLEIGIKVT